MSRRTRPPTARPGSALILVLVATAGLAALAMSAIFLASSSTLMTKYYDHERNYRYASEEALQMGMSQLAKDTTIHLPDSGYVQLMTNAQLKDASGATLPHVRVNLYVGLTGNTTGQFGEFASLVAQAQDSTGETRYVRRLELQAENFARFAMFTNQFSSGLCYSTGEFIRGLGFSNQIWNSCGRPTYYDTISAVQTVGGGSPTYVHGNKSGVAPIPFPTVARLSRLPGYAAAANYSFTTNVKGGARIEFVAINLNAPTDTTATDANEGFFRVFQDTVSTTTGRAYYDLNDAKTSIVTDGQCGDWHTVGGRVMFFPYAVHKQAWFAGYVGLTSGQVTTDTTSNGRLGVMSHTTPRQARCYPSGDPHLVAVERNTSGGAYHPADTTKGGEDTTFTPVTRRGYWVQWPGAVPGPLNAVTSRTPGEKPYLFPLYRAYNPNTKGVIYFNGDVSASGTLNGFVTLYSSANVWFTDDLLYVTDPASVLCGNLLGVIAGQNVWIADNAINSPQNPTTPASPTGPANSVWMSDNKNFYLDGVTMSLTGTVGVENWNSHAINITTCNGTAVGRGCIMQIGGVIEQVISATYNGAGSGFAENRGVDQCMYQESPPFFPLTGRYFQNRFFELDPARYQIDSLYSRLQAL
jgi:hypothetical protein